MANTGDQIDANIGDDAKNIIAGKSNRQTVRESQQVNELYFDRDFDRNSNQDLYRLITGLETRMTNFESTYLVRSMMAEQQRDETARQIDSIERKLDKQPVQGATWVQTLMIVSLWAVVIAMFYFGSGFYVLAHELLKAR